MHLVTSVILPENERFIQNWAKCAKNRVFEPKHQDFELFTRKWVFRLSIGSIVNIFLGYVGGVVIGCRELGVSKTGILGFFLLAFVSKKQKLKRMISPPKTIFFPNPVMGGSIGS